MVSSVRFASLVLMVVGFLLVSQVLNYSVAVHDKEELDGSISIIEAGIGGQQMGGRKMAKESYTGNEETSINGYVEGLSEARGEGNEEGSSMSNRVEEEEEEEGGGSQARVLKEVMQVMRRDYTDPTRPKKPIHS